MLTENFIIEYLKKEFLKTANNERSNKNYLGIGDDCALLHLDEQKSLAITNDVLNEDVHFRTKYFSGDALAHKVLYSNLSDLAAMGAKPLYVLLAISIPKDISSNYIKKFLEEFSNKCKKENINLIGGDTVLSKVNLSISITAIGIIDKKLAKLRKNAKVGDVICTTGFLGDARAGFYLLENFSNFEEDDNLLKEKNNIPNNYSEKGKNYFFKEAQEKSIFNFDNVNICNNKESVSEFNNLNIANNKKNCIEKSENDFEKLKNSQLYPNAKLKEGAWLAKRSEVTAMLDLSDGLYLDLGQICNNSNLSADIEISSLPLSKSLKKYCIENKKNPYLLALEGGEDYELLFTISKEKFDLLKKDFFDEFKYPIFNIGKMTEAKETKINLFFNGKNFAFEDFKIRPFNHFGE